MKLFSWLKPKAQADSPDVRLGTGLWRQHRDRFGRAVDRLYDTAVKANSESAGFAGIEALGLLTHRLSELDARVAVLAENAQRSWPLDGLVLPAEARNAVSDLPELLSQAAGKVSEAAQAAAHVRTSARMHPELPELSERAAASAVQFADDAEALIAQAEKQLERSDF